MDSARVRRNALGDRDESAMSREDIAWAMVAFYKKIVQRRGGAVPAYWDDAFALVMPNGKVFEERGRRDVMLTGEVHQPIDLNFPLSSLYVGKLTGKYSAEWSPAEQALELRSGKERLTRLFSHLNER